MKSCLKSFLLLVTALAFVSCQDDSAFKLKEHDRAEPADANVDANGNQSGEATKTFDFSLKIKSQSEVTKNDENVQIVFLLDNSPSMSDNISLLRQTIPTLFSKISDAGLPYKARVLTLDQFLDQLQVVSNVYMPSGMGNGKPSFDRGALNAKYQSTAVFLPTDGVTPVLSKFDQIASNPKRFDNEPGICLGMDYINWLQGQEGNPNKIGDSDKLHIVMLSDEENADRIEIRNRNTYALEAVKDLYCSYEYQSVPQNEEKRFDRYLSFQQYCYSYRKPLYSYRHQGSYAKKGLCDSQGFSNGSQAEELRSLQSNKYCAQRAYQCQTRRRVTQFECTLNGQTKMYSQNKAGTKVCSQPNSYNCVDAGKQYACAAGNPGSSIYRQMTLSSPNTSMKRCEIAQGFECKQIFDGQEFWEAKSRSEALNLINQYGENHCRVSTSAPNWTATDVSNSFNEVGVQSCSAYTCSEQAINAQLNRAQAINFMNNGGQCTPTSNVSVLEFPSSADETHLTSCNAYSNCSDKSYDAFDTIAKVPESQIGSYENCSAQPVDLFYAPVQRHTAQLNSNNHNSVVAINEASCAAGSYAVDGPTYTINGAGAVCAAGVPALPPGVTNIGAGVSSPKSENLSYNYLLPNQENLNQIKARVSQGLQYATVTMNNDLTSVAEKNGQYDVVDGQNACFTYQAYPAGHPLRSEVEDFSENYAKFFNVLDDGTIKVPPINNRNAVNPVVERRVDRPNGRYSEIITKDPIVTEVKVGATPTDFQDFMRAKFPQLALSWHSIVYNDGPECATSSDSGASLGKQYEKLSELTGGVSSSICASSYESFVKSLTEKVLTEVIIKYELPKGYEDKNPIRVYNSKSRKVLAYGKDYWIYKGHIIFDKRKIKAGDDVQLSY